MTTGVYAAQELPENIALLLHVSDEQKIDTDFLRKQALISMALEPISAPPQFKHDLPEQELILLSPGQQAIARDWSISRQQTQWLMSQVVLIRNAMVKAIENQDLMASQIRSQSVELDVQTKLRKLTIKVLLYFIPSGAATFGFVYLLVKFIKWLWASP